MDSAKYVTQHKRININIGEKIKSKMCNTIKCTIQYTVGLINHNTNRDVQSRLYRVYTHSSNMDDENSEYLTVY